jgi:hypothetical protein
LNRITDILLSLSTILPPRNPNRQGNAGEAGAALSARHHTINQPDRPDFRWGLSLALGDSDLPTRTSEERPLLINDSPAGAKKPTQRLLTHEQQITSPTPCPVVFI